MVCVCVCVCVCVRVRVRVRVERERDKITYCTYMTIYHKTQTIHIIYAVLFMQLIFHEVAIKRFFHSFTFTKSTRLLLKVPTKVLKLWKFTIIFSQMSHE